MKKYVLRLWPVLGFVLGAGACFAADAKENKRLYRQALALYEKTERENRRFARVNGIRLAYLEFGPGHAVPLVWLPASDSTGYEILLHSRGLVAAGYRVIAVDYRGLGKTQIDDFHISLYHVADDIAELMDQLGLRQAVVGGWSKGGYAATAFYDTYPERTLGLLLEDGGSWSQQMVLDEQRLKDPAAWAAENDKRKEAFAGRKVRQFDRRYDAFLSALRRPASDLPVEVAAGIVAKWRQNRDGRWVFHIDDRLMFGDGSGWTLLAPSRFPLLQRSQQLMIPEVIFRNLDVPVHIIDPVSEPDDLPVSGQNRALQRRHPDLIVHEIYENASHAVHFEYPQKVVASAKALLLRVQHRKN